jgi:predicted ATPase
VITKLTIDGFKSFRHVEMNLGKLNLLIGPNASGKSNFLDALRVLQGICRGLTVDEVLNAKATGSGGSSGSSGSSGVEWQSIRGGSSNAAFRDRHGEGAGASDPHITLSTTSTESFPADPVCYSVRFSPVRARILSERLSVGSRSVFESESQGVSEFGKLRGRFHDDTGLKEGLFDGSLSAVNQFLPRFAELKNVGGTIADCILSLIYMQQFQPDTQQLRQRGYAPRRKVIRMGDHGEDFAALVDSLSGQDRSAYVSWLRQLSPVEADDIVIKEGAAADVMFGLQFRGQDVMTPVLSDGTLRFALIAGALFQHPLPLLALEEIENGLHPARLRLLVELLKSRSQDGKPQIVATTHSPLILDWLSREDYDSTFLFAQDEESGESTITPLSQIPRFLELSEKYPASRLLGEGWFETAV